MARSHSRRHMFQLGNGRWVIQCNPCGRRTKRLFDTARECHQYWDQHVTTPAHQYNISPEGAERRQRIQREREALIRVLQSAPRPERPAWVDAGPDPANELAVALIAVSPYSEFPNRYETVRFAREIIYRAEQGNQEFQDLWTNALNAWDALSEAEKAQHAQ